MQIMLYNNLSTYFRKKYGQRLKKICIDAGFSCPNRDGKVSTGGCIFCGERGSGDHIKNPNESIAHQVNSALLSSLPNDKFIAYFQNFTNTYAPVSVLKERYGAALTDKRIVALAVGTRPDCIDREVAKLLASYKDRCDVWVELGLQSSNDSTAELINRGYMRETFESAVYILREYGIDVVAHMIVGLPGEDRNDAVNTAKYISSLDISGIKIHSLYVMEGTSLADMYRNKLYTPPSLQEYAEAVAECIGYIREDMIVHRITGDCPKNLLVAPEWNRDKNAVISLINEIMKETNISQGSLI